MFKAGVKYSFNILKSFFLGVTTKRSVSATQTFKVPAIRSNNDSLKPS